MLNWELSSLKVCRIAHIPDTRRLPLRTGISTCNFIFYNFYVTYSKFNPRRRWSAPLFPPTTSKWSWQNDVSHQKNSNGPLSVAKCGYECGCQCQVETGPGTDFLKATATQRSGTLILSGGLTQTGLHGARAPPLKAFYSGTNQYQTPLGSLGNCGPMNEAESAYSVHPG